MHEKNMFDHYYCINSMIYSPKFTKKYGIIFCHCFTVNRWIEVFINIRVPGPSHISRTNGSAVVKDGPIV